MSFWPLHSLWNRLHPQSSQPIVSISLDGHSALPIELWTHIFLHLDDGTLFHVAAVCHTFTELSVRIALVTNGVPPADLNNGDFTIPSRLLLLLHRGARFITPIKNLSCVFDKSNFSLHLRLLSALVTKSTDLNSVDMQFPRFGLTDWMLDASTHDVFRPRITTLLSQISRDIILVSEQHCLRCSTRDLFTYLCSEITFPPRTRRPTLLIASITSLKLYFQRTRLDDLQPFTMVVVNASTTEKPFTNFVLGYSESWPALADQSRLSTAHLSAMLHRLRLPHLTTLTVIAPRVAATAMGDFLTLHPQIECINDMRKLVPRDPLLQPPLELPNLRKIGASTVNDLLSLLVATAQSAPRTICVPFTQLELPAHPLLFQYLSQRNIPTELSIFVSATTFTEMDLALAKTLHYVDAAFVILDSPEAGTALLPWLKALPALSVVEFDWGSAGVPFLTLVRTSLPGVNVLVGRRT